MLTRCPHCGATFRVTDAHLNAAQGKVRCGACMAIFNATQHLLNTDEPEHTDVQPQPTQRERREPVFTDNTDDSPAEPAASAPEAEAEAEAEDQFDIDSDLIDDNSPLPEDDVSEADLVAELEAALHDEREASFLASHSPAGDELDQDSIEENLDAILESDEFDQSLRDISLESDLDHDLEDLDEQALADAEAELDAILAGAEADEDTHEGALEKSASPPDDHALFTDEEEFLFQDNPEEDRTEGRYHTGKLIADEELSDSFKELDQHGTSAPQFSEDSDDGESPQESDESWAEEMLEELESKGQPKPSALTKAEADLPLRATEPELEPDPAPEPEGIRAAPVIAYDRLRYEPIAVEEEEQQSSGLLGIMGWTVVNAVLLIALAAQLAWFHYDKLARNDTLRPLYALACEHIGCKLPPLLDVSQIKSRNLVVRSHPEVNKALVIDVMAINEASFAQPFPNIAFQFSDLNGNVVAQRVFEPSDYLSGEARELDAMPPETPIHISLEILDPGAEAVNYTMSFKHRLPSET